MKRKIENRRKRILTILMAVLLTLGMTIPVTAEGAPETVSGDSGSTPEQTWMKKTAVSVLQESVPFDDVTDRDWFYQAVCNVYNNKIMNGISDTQFEPAGQVSRGMAVTVLYRMSGQKTDCLSLPFPDVDYHEYFAEAVGWASDTGIVRGFEDGTFRPDDTITREQIAVILSGSLQHALKQKGIHIDVMINPEVHPDWNSVASWAMEDMAWVVGNGLIQGNGPEELLLPQETLSRAELAQILTRIREIFLDDLFSQEESDTFPLKTSDQDRSFTDRMIEQMPPNRNWTLSPYSLEMCLAMAANGANGTSRNEILNTLGIDDLDQYNQQVQELLERYDSYNSIMSLETANSMWLNQDRFNGNGCFLPSFTDALHKFYQSETREVYDRNSVEEINQWVDEKTHGKISRILDENQRTFTTALLNAVYFKAAWLNTFRKEATKPEAFHNLDGTDTDIPFMHQTNQFLYYQTDHIQAVKLPYKNYSVNTADGDRMQFFPDADFGMYFLLSEREIDPQYVLDHADFQYERVDLSIPKFKIEYGGILNEPLEKLGIRTAFSPEQADFRSMIDLSTMQGQQNLFVETVQQNAYLSIDEEGTEASAVTALLTAGSAAPLEIRRTRIFRADKPFWFVIRDDQNDKILFAGKYLQTTK